MADKAGSTSIYLESGKKRVFACALDWSGWWHVLDHAWEKEDRTPQ